MVQAEGHKTLITQLFDRRSPYLENDSVFAVVDNLIVDFHDYKPSSDYKPPAGYDKLVNSIAALWIISDELQLQCQLEYNVVLNKASGPNQIDLQAPLTAEPGKWKLLWRPVCCSSIQTMTTLLLESTRYCILMVSFCKTSDK